MMIIRKHFELGGIPMEALIDVETAAKVLGLSKHTLRGMVSRRQIRHVKLGRRCLFRPTDLAEIVSKGLQEPMPRGERK